MKIMITWLHKNGKCRSWTNADLEEYTCMSFTVWADAVKRLGEKWNVTPKEVVEKIKKIINKESV